MKPGEKNLFEIYSRIVDSKHLKDLSNDQIADMLMERIWADIDLTTMESWIVFEAIERLRLKIGVDR